MDTASANDHNALWHHSPLSYSSEWNSFAFATSVLDMTHMSYDIIQPVCSKCVANSKQFIWNIDLTKQLLFVKPDSNWVHNMDIFV